jgi:DnaJ-class molecular chaperone
MNIKRSYKALDLKADAPIDEVRKAYKDMVRVWHPDRFGDNPRLRAKANEKLKEINLAYGEIKKSLAKDINKHSDIAKPAQKKGEVHVDHKPPLFEKKKLLTPLSAFHSLLMKSNFKKYFRELMLPKITPKNVPPEPSKQQNSKLHRHFVAKKVRKKKRMHFSEILEEVARSNKKKVIYAKERSKDKRL